MKKLFVLMVLSLSLLQHAHASGCGGPEYYIEETKVLQSLPFADAIENYSIGIFTSKDGEQRVQFDFYSTKMPAHPSTNFYWHTATPEGALPVHVTFEGLANLLKYSTVEIVEDKYSIICGYAAKETETNFRIRLNYEGQPLVLRTNYTPEAEPQ